MKPLQIGKQKSWIPARGFGFVALVLGMSLQGMAQTYFFEDFEGLTLGPNDDEGLSNPTAWTKVPPMGWRIDDSGVPGVKVLPNGAFDENGLNRDSNATLDNEDGVTEWAGWSFANKDWWTDTAGDQRRSEFTRASGTVLVADPDEWDDASHLPSAENGWFNTTIFTPKINITGAAANTLVLGFDSSWRPEFDSNYRQSGKIEATFGTDAPAEVLRWLSDPSSPFFKNDESTNEYIIVPLNNPAGATELELAIEMFDAGNDWWWTLDNIVVGVPPLLIGFEVSPAGIILKLADANGVSLQTNSVALKLNGETIQTTSVSQGFDGSVGENVTTIAYLLDGDFLPPNTALALELSYNNSLGESVVNNLTVNVPDFPILGAADAAAADSVDTSKVGFVARTVQSELDHQNRINLIERLLRGQLIDCATGNPVQNLADLSGADSNGRFAIDGVVNFDKDAFNAGLFDGDTEFPGIPGSNSFGEPFYDRFAMEIVTYLELERGAYRIGMNSDDAGMIAVGGNPRDQFATQLGGGGGDVTVDFAVSEAGLYPVRFVYFDREITGFTEIFSVDLATGEKTLINDGSANALKGYQAWPANSYVKYATPSAGNNVNPGFTLSAFIEPGSDEVDASSVTLSLNGNTVDTTIETLTDGAILASWKPESIPSAGSTHTAAISYSVNGTIINREWSFTVANYTQVPVGLATPLGSGSNPGMKWRTHQIGSARGTSIAEAEAQLAGDLGASIHETSAGPIGPEGSDGFFDIDVVNFDQAGGESGFFRLNGPGPEAVQDGFLPGIVSNTDNIAAETIAYVEFPEAGVYDMAVSSDDGFEVAVGFEGDTNFLRLGAFDGGRGTAETRFAFGIPEAGVYLVRLLWFEGGGGANVEWYSYGESDCRALINGNQPGALTSYRNRQPAITEPPVMVQPIISGITREGNEVVIVFEGTLYTAPDVNGPFTEVQNATSPYRTTADGAQRFFQSAQ